MRSAGGTITLLAFFSSLLHIFCTVQAGCRFPAGDAPKRSFSLPLTPPQWLSLPLLPSYYIMSAPGCQAPAGKVFPLSRDKKERPFCQIHSCENKRKYAVFRMRKPPGNIRPVPAETACFRQKQSKIAHVDSTETTLVSASRFVHDSQLLKNQYIGGVHVLQHYILCFRAKTNRFSARFACRHRKKNFFDL